ncbi:hypothetical protein H8E88_35500 [candidate division KSB1 bacterium]|nr:hypothetical protein [candidate division KSB1 bacterium]MBL7095332.1 hypothetical protein [candidate division KSB1 bacterium]
MAKDIIINFMPPGMLDFGVIDNGEDIETTGYGPVGLGDLQVDRDTKTGEFLSFIANTFENTYFDIIEKLNKQEVPFRYNIPEAGLENLTLREVLTWIYSNYVLKEKRVKVA